MIVLTLPELTALTVGLAVTVVAAVFVDVSCAWRQEKEIRRQRLALSRQQEQLARLDADIDVLWKWSQPSTDVDEVDHHEAEPEHHQMPAEPGEEPATVVSHPADSFARKQSLLARYAASGQHRAGGRAQPTNDSASPAPAPPRTER